MVEIFFLGSLTALSVFVLLYKINNKMWESLTIDSIITIGLMFIFGHTFTGLAISIVAGLLISVILYFYEPKVITDIKENLYKEFNNDR